ncbi:MAG: helix-turn-helix domain-containing protein [Clostridia bacterium]
MNIQEAAKNIMPKIMTLKEVSEYLKISEYTVRYTLKIPFIKLGGLIRYREEDILEFLEKSIQNKEEKISEEKVVPKKRKKGQYVI